MLFTFPISAEVIFLFQLKVIVGAVIEKDILAPFHEILAVFVKLCLNEIILLGQNRQCTVNVMQFKRRLFQEQSGLLVGSLFGRRIENACENEFGKDIIQIILKEMSGTDRPTYFMQAKAIVNILKEKIPTVIGLLFPFF